MAATSTNSGFCALCGHRATKTKMMAHVEACVAAHDETGQPQPLGVLRFAPAGAPRYWLVIEAKADAQFGHVDGLLRQLFTGCTLWTLATSTVTAAWALRLRWHAESLSFTMAVSSKQ